MSFWGSLGKIASVAAPIAAIPFTGGASALALGASGAASGASTLSKILGAVGSAAPVLGGIASGRASGRTQDVQNQGNVDYLNLQRSNLVNQALQREFENKLALSKLEADLPNLRASQAARGDIMANVQDFRFTGPLAGGRVHVTPSTGGLRPSQVFGPATRSAGRSLANIGSSKIGNEQLPEAPSPAPYGQISPVPGSGIMDKLLGGAAGAAGILGALPKRPSPVPVRQPQNIGGVDPFALPNWQPNPMLPQRKPQPLDLTYGGF